MPINKAGNSLLLGAAFALASSSVLAAEPTCGPLNGFQIEKTYISSVSLNAAIAQLTRGTPFRVEQNAAAAVLVPEQVVSGRLGDVLSKLAAPHGLSISASNCVLQFGKSYVRKPAPAGYVRLTPDVKQAPAEPTWTLREGQLIGKELQNWGHRAGWKVIWNLPKDVTVPASAHFKGDFKTVASQVITALADNGMVIRAHFADGNKAMIVTGAGVAEQ